MQAWDPKRDGWLVTEDLGRVTPEGVDVLGRASDSVKVLGELVSVSRVEEVARRWAQSLAAAAGPALDVAVVALPHPRLGHELVVALADTGGAGFSVPQRNQAIESLLAFSRDALLPYEQPHRVAWVERIPRTALGKCQRSLLAREVSLQPGTQG